MNWPEIALHVVGGPISHLWPLIILPGLVALVCEFAARRLPPTRADWRLAALLAALPGTVMLVVCLFTLLNCLSSPHVEGWVGLVACRIPPVLAVLLLGRAIALAALRQLALQKVIGIALPPGPRLAGAARSVGVQAFEIPLRTCECFVAGFAAPAAYVSSGTVERVSDSELRAMLHHERAHAAGRDSAMLTILSFLRDLVPAGRRGLDAFCEARERRADREAVKAEGAVPLASALLEVAKSQVAAPALGMGGSSCGAWRLHAILGTESPAPAGPASGLLVASALVFASAAASWPLLQNTLAQMLCPGSL